jgi:NAD(P)-dependent dehydrogenase (short-subunit alcohol dehydrogenase family)
MRRRKKWEQWSLNQASRNTRWGSPDQLANLIVFALSDAASFVNGAVLAADNAMDKSQGPPCAPQQVKLDIR